MAQVERKAYSPEGGADPFFEIFWPYASVFALFGLGAVLLIIVGGLMACNRNVRSTGLAVLFTGLCCISGCIGSCNTRNLVFGNPRREAFTQMGGRMMPLVNAIETYHRETGSYPQQLTNLIPKYLENIPSTQMRIHTNINYYVGDEARRFEGNPWILNIPAEEGMGFNQFYYFPLQNYPAGWPYEHMGKWAYFHE